MRKIKIEKWKSKDMAGKDVDESSVDVITTILSARDDHAPRGFDAMRMEHRIADCIDKAEKTGVLEMEEAEFVYLKSKLERLAPAQWGMNKHVFPVVDGIINAPMEK